MVSNFRFFFLLSRASKILPNYSVGLSTFFFLLKTLDAEKCTNYSCHYVVFSILPNYSIGLSTFFLLRHYTLKKLPDYISENCFLVG